jgi:Fe2+ transport system protein FeoA
MWKRILKPKAACAAATERERCGACPLAACARGARAAVLRMECDGGEARRLRNLGVYEGAHVTVLDRQDGLLLDVRGSRLALGAALASSITVLPLGT